MGNNVFANGREVSCKAGDGKSICTFPDVCMTPPENPATPPGVPIPYPNTGMAKDTAGGSKTVKVSKKETMLKNQSHFKKSMGDEAGSAAKKGVVSSVNRGKVYFKSWSMDVKFEGTNVVRHLDMTTHNHASEGPNTPPGLHTAKAAAGSKEDDEKCPKCGRKKHDTKYRRSKSERKKALLRDADDPNSALTPKDREFIKKHKGNRVPKGYQVSHDEPLYTKEHKDRCELDVADNMETIPTDEHTDLHRECGKTYHLHPPRNY